MKKYWNIYSDIFGLTVFHPQFIVNKFHYEAITLTKKLAAGKNLLDIGCGRMTDKKYFLETVKSYTGLDHPTARLKYNAPSKPDIISDVQKLKVQDKSYDAATLLQVMEYLDEPLIALKEIYRILTPGGVLILSSPFMYPLHDGDIDKNRFSKSKIRDLLKAAGFKKINIKYQGNFYTFLINSFLVYYFKKAYSLKNKVLTLFLIIVGILMSVILNTISLIFNKNNDDYPINLLASAVK